MFPIKTRYIRHSETVEFRHDFITVPIVTPEEQDVSVITKLKQELADITSPSSSLQLIAIKQLQTMFSKHKNNKPSTNINVDEQDAMPHQNRTAVESNQLLTPKKKVLAFKENLAEFLRVSVGAKPSLPQHAIEPSPSQQ